MAFRNARPDPLFGVAVSVVLLFVAAGLTNHHNKAERAESAARQGYQSSMSVAPIGAVPDLHYTDPASYSEEWRAERDLEAQEAMARWAKWLLAATIVGIVLVAATLVETRRTAQAAADAAAASVAGAEAAVEANRLNRAMFHASIRPWLVFGKGVVVGSNEFDACEVWLKWKNAGRSPAMNVGLYLGIQFVPSRSFVGPPGFIPPAEGWPQCAAWRVRTERSAR